MTFSFALSSPLTFVLRGISPAQIDQKYLMKDMQLISTQQFNNSNEDPTLDNLTRLTSSSEMFGMSRHKTKSLKTIALVNDLNVKLFVSPMLNSNLQILNVVPSTIINNKATVEDTLVDIKMMRKCFCWHCRHSIPQEWHPLGIPIKYRVDDHAFECEGVFCSFNCVMAYLSEAHEYRYKDSTVLVAMMWRIIFGVIRKITDIIPAPSWKLLREYGGPLSIDEYRKNLQAVEYRTLHQLLRNDKIRIAPLGEMFVEHT